MRVTRTGQCPALSPVSCKIDPQLILADIKVKMTNPLTDDHEYNYSYIFWKLMYKYHSILFGNCVGANLTWRSAKYYTIYLSSFMPSGAVARHYCSDNKIFPTCRLGVPTPQAKNLHPRRPSKVTMRLTGRCVYHTSSRLLRWIARDKCALDSQCVCLPDPVWWQYLELRTWSVLRMHVP